MGFSFFFFFGSLLDILYRSTILRALHFPISSSSTPTIRLSNHQSNVAITVLALEKRSFPVCVIFTKFSTSLNDHLNFFFFHVFILQVGGDKKNISREALLHPYEISSLSRRLGLHFDQVLKSWKMSSSAHI